MRRQDVTVRVSPNSLATAVPFCVMAVVTCFDLVVGTQVGFMSLLSLGPALAPVSLGPVRTALTGGVAVVLSFLLAAVGGIAFSTHAVESCATIAGVTVAAVIASAARQRKERELVDVRAVADVAQRVLLHRVPREVGQLQIAVRYISAAAAARIGGDLYDVVAVAGTARLIVADVQGKGLAAVQTAAVVLAAFRESVYDEPDLAAIASHIERSLEHQAPGDRFVTAIMAEIPRDGAGDPPAELRAPVAAAAQRRQRAVRGAAGSQPAAGARLPRPRRAEGAHRPVRPGRPDPLLHRRHQRGAGHLGCLLPGRPVRPAARRARSGGLA